MHYLTTNEPLDVIVLLCYSFNCMRVSIQLLAAIQINQLIDCCFWLTVYIVLLYTGDVVYRQNVQEMNINDEFLHKNMSTSHSTTPFDDHNYCIRSDSNRTLSVSLVSWTHDSCTDDE